MENTQKKQTKKQEFNYWPLIALGVVFILVALADTFLAKPSTADELETTLNAISDGQHVAISYSDYETGEKTFLCAPIAELHDDKSLYNYQYILKAENSVENFSLIPLEQDLIESDLATSMSFEDTCVQSLLEQISEMENYPNGTLASFAIPWYDIGLNRFILPAKDEQRLMFKCELIAQKFGFTTLGEVRITTDGCFNFFLTAK